MDIDLLSKMVKELILDNDKVVLPGLGCFVAEIVPSTFSDKGYTINPPYRKLSFRAKPDHGDELARFYADTNNVGYDVAGRIITDFVAELKSVLHQKKTVVFPALGRLRATKENTVFFVADENLDIYPAGFGLEPVSLKTHQQTREEVSAAIEGLRSIFDRPAVHAAETFSSAPEIISGSNETGPAPALPSENATSGNGTVEHGNSEKDSFEVVPEEMAVPEKAASEKTEKAVSEKDDLCKAAQEEQQPVSEAVVQDNPETDRQELSNDSPADDTLPVRGTADLSDMPSISADDVSTTSGEACSSSMGEAAEASQFSSAAEASVTSFLAAEVNEAENMAADTAEQNTAEHNDAGAERAAADANPGVPGKSIWKILLWTIAGIAVLLILAMGTYMALAIYSPEFLDSLLYTPEELDIINYNGKF